MTAAIGKRAHAARLARFGVVGMVTAAFYYGALVVLVEVLRMSPTVASGGVYLAALGFNYWLHYHWTFAATSSHGRSMMRYGVMSGTAWLLNLGIMAGGVALGWNYLLVQTAAFVVIVSWNLLLGNLWVYRADPDSPALNSGRGDGGQ